MKCIICGKEINDNNKEVHHISYPVKEFPEVTVPVHKKCHNIIHHTDYYEELQPRKGHSRIYYNDNKNDKRNKESDNTDEVYNTIFTKKEILNECLADIMSLDSSNILFSLTTVFEKIKKSKYTNDYIYSTDYIKKNLCQKNHIIKLGENIFVGKRPTSNKGWEVFNKKHFKEVVFNTNLNEKITHEDLVGKVVSWFNTDDFITYTIDDVVEYGLEKGIHLNPKKVYEYLESKDWIIKQEKNKYKYDKAKALEQLIKKLKNKGDR